MKCISVKQPWAHLIINGYKGSYKDIENRNWKREINERVLIHASKEVDEDAMKRFGLENEYLPTGCVIGSVEFCGYVTESNSKWFTGKYGYVLKNPQKITPFKFKGQLGFFNVSEDILK